VVEGDVGGDVTEVLASKTRKVAGVVAASGSDEGAARKRPHQSGHQVLMLAAQDRSL